MRLRAGAALLCLLLFLRTVCRGAAVPASADTSAADTSVADASAADIFAGDASPGEGDSARLLRDGLWGCLDCIDLSACRLPREEMSALFSAVVLDSPELFHTDSRMSYTYGRDGCVLAVFPVYVLTGDALAAARLLYADTIRDFLADLSAAASPPLCLPPETGVSAAPPAWSEADTVLFIHEWLAARYAYDAEGVRFDALSLFRDGVGVCQAYALAFLALARAAGLEAEVVVSAEMDHAWNRVRVENAWYHVDVTRDDRCDSNDSRDAIYHDRLLMSDDTARAQGYAGYDVPPGHECVSGEYDGLYAVLSSLPPARLCRAGDGWVLYEGGLPCRADLRTGESGLPGDADGDGTVTLRDLLLLDAAGLEGDAVRGLLVAVTLPEPWGAAPHPAEPWGAAPHPAKGAS